MGFRAVWWRRIGDFAGICIAAIWITFNIYFLINSRSALPGVIFIGLFSGMLAIMVIAAAIFGLKAIFQFSTGKDEIVIRSVLATNTIPATQIKHFDVKVKGRDSSVLLGTVEGKEFTIPLRIYANPSEARRALEAWFAQHPQTSTTNPSTQTRVFRARNFANFVFGFACFLVLLLVVLPVFFIPDRTILLASVPLTGAFMVASFMSYHFAVTITPNTIIVKRYGPEVMIPLESITRITLRVTRSRSGTNEVMEISWSGKPKVIGETYDNFPQIRESILAMVSPEIVVDQRPH